MLGNGKLFVFARLLTVFVFTAAYATGKTVRYYDAETGEELAGEQLGGRAYTARTLNEAGDRLGDGFFDAAGLPALVEGDNFHRIEYTWDENGHEIAVSFFGLAGEPVLNNGAFHRCEREVAGGRELAKAYFGLGGEPVVLKGYDFHRVETTFDEQGRETSVSLFGPGGEAGFAYSF